MQAGSLKHEGEQLIQWLRLQPVSTGILAFSSLPFSLMDLGPHQKHGNSLQRPDGPWVMQACRRPGPGLHKTWARPAEEAEVRPMEASQSPIPPGHSQQEEVIHIQMRHVTAPSAGQAA